jgi:hypothetical protein
VGGNGVVAVASIGVSVDHVKLSFLLETNILYEVKRVDFQTSKSLKKNDFAHGYFEF